MCHYDYCTVQYSNTDHRSQYLRYLVIINKGASDTGCLLVSTRSTPDDLHYWYTMMTYMEVGSGVLGCSVLRKVENSHVFKAGLKVDPCRVHWSLQIKPQGIRKLEACPLPVSLVEYWNRKALGSRACVSQVINTLTIAITQINLIKAISADTTSRALVCPRAED